MRFASLESVRLTALDTVRRFPLALGSAWTAALVSSWLILKGGQHPYVTAVLFAATLGLPLFIAIALRAERQGPASSRVVLPALAVGALVGIAWLWPQWTEAVQLRRYLQMSVVVHVLVAVLPYLGVREPNGFWQYNRALFQRMIVATVFAGVLLAGLQGALASLNPLFGIRVSGKAFGLLATWVYSVFHPWFFLAGVPRDLSSLERRDDYPAGIRVFAQFILVPLVAVYQALLTAYLVKVIVTSQWPKGLIGWLVSVEAVAGILAILLVHPVRDRAETRWVRTFSRAFYVALVPSIVMLMLAIGKRIGQYGVTEDRYFVVVLAAWLAGITLYFVARRDGDIRWIPVSLGAVALLTTAGPWSAYAVSRASQSTRLEAMLRTHGLLADGEARPATRDLPVAARKELGAVLDYLLRNHGAQPVRAVMGPVVAARDSVVDDPRKPPSAAVVMRRIGLVYVASWETPTSESFSYVATYSATRVAERVSGYDFHVTIDRGLPLPFTAAGRPGELRLDPESHELVVVVGADTTCVFPLDPAIDAARLPSPHADGSGLLVPARRGHGLLRLRQLTGRADKRLEIWGFAGDLYF